MITGPLKDHNQILCWMNASRSPGIVPWCCLVINSWDTHVCHVDYITFLQNSSWVLSSSPDRNKKFQSSTVPNTPGVPRLSPCPNVLCYSQSIPCKNVLKVLPCVHCLSWSLWLYFPISVTKKGNQSLHNREPFISNFNSPNTTCLFLINHILCLANKIQSSCKLTIWSIYL